MGQQLSFTTRQWWLAIGCAVLILVLMFATGFVGGAMWQRSRTPAPAAVTKALKTTGVSYDGRLRRSWRAGGCTGARSRA